jgi:perosamine synthetase
MTVVEQFERLFNSRMGQSYAAAFWKARVALYAVLRSLGVGPGDEVILPGYTCVMNVNPIKYLGAKPVYVDIEPDTCNMDVSLLEEKITPRTKVIIAQHTYGYPCDMDAIMTIAARRGITMIEDCCLALGSTYRGKTVGTFGKAAYFSFQWNKPFTTGLGGMAITNDTDLAEKIKGICDGDLRMPSAKEVAMLAAQLAVYRMFIYPRTTAMAQRMFRYLASKGAIIGSFSNSEYTPRMSPDFFKAMSSVQARRGINQLAMLDQNLAHRRVMAALYDELLAQRGWQPRVYDKSVMDPVMVRYPVRITEKDKALAAAAGAGIELGGWFECPLHQIQTSFEEYDYKIGMCPNAERIAREVVNLPVHPRAGETTAKRTVEFITRYTQAV